ncbi:thermoresistant gluconokinase [Emericellopsis atlantica]|uniref:Gluconokinase n=1 Tax=Emericellopsis atlantica TaxID=2614577 RepID=A0A9P7ZD37_9HYPO|nr:thermoresistant gluconokinase [Emericellopsis atlantica]KAG9249849.1 thermoresistant gluconokinase [Emericellopsis atlantica]
MLSYDAPMPAAQGQKDTAAMTTLSGQAAAPTTAGGRAQTYQHHHIWLVTGPAGCGKSTVAEHLSQALSLPYIEGDSFHPPANIEKMANGTPLTDADRWDWLTVLREESTRLISSGSEGVVLTCSALKRKYRDVIRVAAYYDPSLLIHFIYLDASEETLLQRVAQRKGHYMGANMVHSQFDILERPGEDEKDVIKVDVSRTLEEVKGDALHRVVKVMGDDEVEEEQQ